MRDHTSVAFVPGSVLLWSAFTTIALFHAALALTSLRRNSPTVDEVSHLPAGVSYLQKRTFALYHQNPPLVKMLAALPVLASRPQVDYSRSWARAFVRGDAPSPTTFGAEFLRSNRSRFFTLFVRARAVVVAMSLCGLLVTFLWAREIWGGLGGLIAATLWAFSPNLLAHAGLVTTDLGATVFGFISTFFFWRWLRQRTWNRAWLSGVALGTAQLAKFSNLILYGIWPCLLTVWWLAGRQKKSADRKQRASSGIQISQYSLMLTLSVFVINLGYGFEGTGQALGKFDFSSEGFTSPSTQAEALDPSSEASHVLPQRRQNRFRDTAIEGLPVPLPKHFVLGFDRQWSETNPGASGTGYHVYLRGELRQSGWWYYYLYAMLVKIPLGTWLLLAGALVLGIRRPAFQTSFRDECVLALPPVIILAATSLLTDINLGMRYVLPIVPYLFLTIGRLGRVTHALPRWSTFLKAFVAVGVLGNVVVAVAIWPHYLSFFNVLAGGPKNGHRHLIDSNLDWGQDLFELKRWLERNPSSKPVGLAYFGTIDPGMVGIDYFFPPRDPRQLPETETLLPGERKGIQPGLYAISVNFLQGLPFPGYMASGRLARLPPYAFSYFRHITPVARAGYSIWIFRIGPDEAKTLNDLTAGKVEEGTTSRIRKDSQAVHTAPKGARQDRRRLCETGRRVAYYGATFGPGSSEGYHESSGSSGHRCQWVGV